MAWYIKKDVTNVIGVGTVYYQGDDDWSTDISDKISYTSKAKANAAISLFPPDCDITFSGVATAFQ